MNNAFTGGSYLNEKGFHYFNPMCSLDQLVSPRNWSDIVASVSRSHCSTSILIP